METLKVEETEIRHSSFTFDGAMMMLDTMRDGIEAVSPNYELLDEAGNVVKSGDVTGLSVFSMEDVALISFIINDTTTDTYTFRRVRVSGRVYVSAAGSSFGGWSGLTQVMINHTFAQNYTKGSAQTLHAVVRTGIKGCTGS